MAATDDTKQIGGERAFLRLSECAAILGISTRQAYRWASAAVCRLSISAASAVGSCRLARWPRCSWLKAKPRSRLHRHLSGPEDHLPPPPRYVLNCNMALVPVGEEAARIRAEEEKRKAQADDRPDPEDMTTDELRRYSEALIEPIIRAKAVDRGPVELVTFDVA